MRIIAHSRCPVAKKQRSLVKILGLPRIGELGEDTAINWLDRIETVVLETGIRVADKKARRCGETVAVKQLRGEVFAAALNRTEVERLIAFAIVVLEREAQKAFGGELIGGPEIGQIRSK